MKNKIYLWLILFAMLVMISYPISAGAAPSLDVRKDCTLTLHYTPGDEPLKDYEVKIYQVADYFADGSYSLTSTFSRYYIGIHGVATQKEWKNIAETLASYVEADTIDPTDVGKTDENGVVVFSNLRVGMYLIISGDANISKGQAIYEPFAIFLPKLTDGVYEYEIEAYPKSDIIINTPTKEPNIKYSVIKLWKDSGASGGRPASVKIDILENGGLYKSIELGTHNNWSYSWETTNKRSAWTVVEREVPENYSVSITRNGAVFTVVNTIEDPGAVPKTSDDTPLGAYTVGLAMSGMCLAVLIMMKKGKKA